jgi:hypothetical protein
VDHWQPQKMRAVFWWRHAFAAPHVTLIDILTPKGRESMAPGERHGFGGRRCG